MKMGTITNSQISWYSHHEKFLIFSIDQIYSYSQHRKTQVHVHQMKLYPSFHIIDYNTSYWKPLKYSSIIYAK